MLILSFNDDNDVIAVNPVEYINTAVKASLDRLSAADGKLFKRVAINNLAVVTGPFITLSSIKIKSSTKLKDC